MTIQVDAARQWHLTPLAKVQWHNRAQMPIEIFDYGKGDTPTTANTLAREWVVLRCQGDHRYGVHGGPAGVSGRTTA